MAEEEKDGGEMGRDWDADEAVSFVAGRLSRGVMLEDQPRKEEVTSRTLVCLRPRCMLLFTMPSKGATQDLLKCLTTPQAASKPAAAEPLYHWLEVIQYLSAY